MYTQIIIKKKVLLFFFTVYKNERKEHKKVSFTIKTKKYLI